MKDYKEYMKQWRHDHKDEIREYAKKKYISDGVTRKEKMTNYKERNKDKIKQYNARNREHTLEYMKDYHTRNKYGITLKQKCDMLASQNNKCALCGNIFSSNTLICIDHDHATGKLRALLCSACNTGLGCFKDSNILFHKAINYLKRGG